MNKRTLVALFLVVVLVVLAGAANAGMFDFLKKAKKVGGTIESIDASAKCFVVSVKDKKYTVQCNDKTAIKCGKDSKIFADLKVGQEVKAKGAMKESTLSAKEVNFVEPKSSTPAGASTDSTSANPSTSTSTSSSDSSTSTSDKSK